MTTEPASHHTVAPALPVALPVLDVVRETPRMASLIFPLPDPPDDSFDAVDVRAGQFVMVWLPRLNEKPYAVSMLDEARFAITVMRRGEFSTTLHDLPVGSFVGFRGPYGRAFDVPASVEPGRVALLAGGCGAAPMALLADRLPGCHMVQGAPTADEVLFPDRFPDQVVFTDDGSRGRTGLPTEWLSDALSAKKLDLVCACGPEMMLVAVVELCRAAGVPCQVSMERYMKCGFGVCGQCECSGQLVCCDGPIFTGDELAAMPDFGRMTRLKTGARVTLAEEGACSAG